LIGKSQNSNKAGTKEGTQRFLKKFGRAK
jgi:hypothetical protein